MAAVMRAFVAQDSDAAIISRSQQEPECFAAVFDRYYAQIHGYAARRLGPSLADDVAAETFLIASNLIRVHHRAEQRRYRALSRVGAETVSESYADQVALRVDAQARRAPLVAALAEIAAADRDVLLLVACAGLNSEEVGQALGIPAGTARSRLHRARKQVRAALGEVSPPTGKDDQQ